MRIDCRRLSSINIVITVYSSKIAHLISVFCLTVSTLVSSSVWAQEKVVVSYDGTAGFNGPIWAAQDLHLFDAQRLRSDLILVSGSARAMAALISDSIQFAQGSATAAIPVQLRGGDVVIIAAALNKFPFTLVAQKGIRKPADLIGKKIGVLNFGGSNELAVNLALNEWNIPRQSVTVLATGSAPARLSAMSTKALDATVLSPPETFMAARMDLNVLAQLTDLKASFPQSVIAVRRSFLEKNRDAVKKFMRAYSEAIYIFKSNKQKVLSVYARRLKQQDSAVIEQTHAYFAPKFSFPPRVDPDGMRNVLDQVSQREPEARRPFRVDRFLDESITDELEKEGFFNSLTEREGRK